MSLKIDVYRDKKKKTTDKYPQHVSRSRRGREEEEEGGFV